MANIFSLYGSIFIDNEKANKAIDDTTKKGKESSKGWLSSLGSIASSVGKVSFAVGTAATAIVAGVSAMASKFSEGAKEIQVMSERVGWSTTKYQEWNYIAQQTGTTMDTLQGGITDLAEKMDDASSGSGEAAEIFKRLGLSVKDANGNLKDQNVMFEEVIVALQKVEDATERQALATKLMSTTGEELLPIINDETGSIEKLKQQAHDLGIVMGEDTVNAGAKFKESLSQIQSVFISVFNQVMTTLIPSIQTILDLIVQNMPVIQNLILTIAPILTILLSSLLPPLMDLAQAIFPILIDLINQLLPFITQIIQTILPIIVDLINMLLPPLLQIIQMILPLLLNLIQPLLPLLSPLLELLQPLIDLLMLILQPLMELLNVLLPPLISLLSIITQTIMPLLSAQFTYVANIIGNVFGTALSYITSQIEVAKNIFMNIIDFIRNVFTGNWSAAWQNVKNIFGNIISGIANMFKLPINLIIDGINAFIKGLNKLKIPDWVPGVGGKGLSIPLMKKLRIGMEYVPYDDMPALLHKGERVLTAEEAKEYKEAQSSVVNNETTNNFNVTINSTEPLSPAETARQTRKVFQEYILKHGKA